MNPLAKYATLIEAIAIAAILAACAWGVHLFLEHERDIGRNEVRAEWQQKLAEAKEAAAVEQQRLNKQLEDARNEYTERDKLNRQAAANATAANNGLRAALAGIGAGVPSASIETLRLSTTALAAVFGDCAERYRQLGEKADRHANDVRLFYDGWPGRGNAQSAPLPATSPGR